MSDSTIQYISLGLGAIAFAYTAVQHVFHRANNKNNDIQHTIKYNNLDQNIQNIKELFQKIIKSNLFNSVNKEVKDLENQVKDNVENIITYDYDKIKEVVQNEKSVNRETITKVSNVLALSQNIQNHINMQTEQQASNNQLNAVRKTVSVKTIQDKNKISVYELKPNN